MCENIKDEIKNLYETLAKINDPKDIENLFNDLCTYKEIDSMAQRLESAKLLLEGETYEQVIKKTNLSSATLSRVSKCVKYGEGYKKVLNKHSS